MILGEKVREAVNRGINSSSIVICFISTKALASGWCEAEVSAAFARENTEKKTIVIPVLIGGIKDNDLPPDIQSKLYLDLRGNHRKKYSRYRHLLVHAIRIHGGLKADTHDSPKDVWVPVGDDLIAFFMNHRYSSGTGTPDLKRLYAKICRATVDAIAKDADDDSALREFYNSHGGYVLQKVAAYFLSESGTDITEQSTPFDIESVFDSLNTLATLFFLQQTIHEAAENGGWLVSGATGEAWLARDVQIVAKIENGDIVAYKALRGEWQPIQGLPQDDLPFIAYPRPSSPTESDTQTTKASPEDPR